MAGGDKEEPDPILRRAVVARLKETEVNLVFHVEQRPEHKLESAHFNAALNSITARLLSEKIVLQKTRDILQKEEVGPEKIDVR